jgi:hypothetical protein
MANEVHKAPIGAREISAHPDGQFLRLFAAKTFRELHG